MPGEDIGIVVDPSLINEAMNEDMQDLRLVTLPMDEYARAGCCCCCCWC